MRSGHPVPHPLYRGKSHVVFRGFDPHLQCRFIGLLSELPQHIPATLLGSVNPVPVGAAALTASTTLGHRLFQTSCPHPTESIRPDPPVTADPWLLLTWHLRCQKRYYAKTTEELADPKKLRMPLAFDIPRGRSYSNCRPNLSPRRPRRRSSSIGFMPQPSTKIVAHPRARLHFRRNFLQACERRRRRRPT